MLERTGTDETWRIIQDFPDYEISDLGNVFNIRTEKQMKTSITRFGHVKISLLDRSKQRHSRSVAYLVAEAFVEPPGPLCDKVVVLDGDPTNLAAQNLAWRPWWFVCTYTRQLKSDQPLHMKNIPVVNQMTGDRYSSIIACGMREGLIFKHIWRSTYTGDRIFPYGHSYEIFKRV